MTRAGRRPGGRVPAGVLAVPLAVLLLAGCTGTVDGDAAPSSAPSASAGGPEVTLADTEVATYAPGQQHVPTDVDYPESPPVGGAHDPRWADCTGTVYDVPLRPENAVHSMEHGAVWATYDPDLATDEDVAALTALVQGRSGTLLSPYPGLGVPVSLQAWNHQLRLESGSDPRAEQFVTLLAFNADTTPELGATCENPTFLP